MDNNSPQLSFIPKSPLTREESFLDRPRPRSLLGFFASLIFLASVGSYAGLYFYNDVLASRIESLTAEINKVQKDFEQPEINQARVFYARAELVRALLDSHIVASPIFDFLEVNTSISIFYNDLSFKRDDKGAFSVTVDGEAPSYASLAYQADVFRQSEKLSSFSIENVDLTNSGNVWFSFKMAFTPEYLSYARQYSATASQSVGGERPAMASSSPSQGTSPSLEEETAPRVVLSGGEDLSEVLCVEPLVRIVQSDGSVVCGEREAVPVASSWLASFWSTFKFW